MTLRFVDFFSGIGGFHQGFKRDFTQCVFACEIDANARKSYMANYTLPAGDYAQDITTVDEKTMPDFDIFCGGFPCQAFSIAGLRQGLNDPRGKLFLDITRILTHKQPKAFLLENVKGLLNHDKGNTFKFIKTSLEACGYTVQHKVMNTVTHGNLPQNRERVFLVGIRNDITKTFTFPDVIPLTGKVRDILESSVANKYYYSSTSAIYPKLVAEVTDVSAVYQYRRVFVRKNTKNVCPTLTANMGGGGHNVPIILDGTMIRKLTPRECFRLQGFPDSFVFPTGMADVHLYKQAGNAVSVPVISRIADEIFKTIM